jgi:hypothetical protein
VGPRHDLPENGLPGPGHLLGAAAWGERGCGDDVRGLTMLMVQLGDRLGALSALPVSRFFSPSSVENVPTLTSCWKRPGVTTTRSVACRNECVP